MLEASGAGGWLSKPCEVDVAVSKWLINTEFKKDTWESAFSLLNSNNQHLSPALDSGIQWLGQATKI